MNNSNDSIMVVERLSGTVSLDLAGRSGLVPFAYNTSAQSGYKIENKTSSGDVKYQEITITRSKPEEEPPDITVKVSYVQETAYPEVDLDIRYFDIPKDSFFKVESSDERFSISKKAISGTGISGKQGKEVGKLDIKMTLKLWIKDPSGIKENSAIHFSMFQIKKEKEIENPDPKVLLGQFVLNLSTKS